MSTVPSIQKNSAANRAQSSFVAALESDDKDAKKPSKAELSFKERDDYIKAQQAEDKTGWTKEVEEWTMTRNWIESVVGNDKINDADAVQKFIDAKLGKYVFAPNGLAMSDKNPGVDSLVANIQKIEPDKKGLSLVDRVTTTMFWAADKKGLEKPDKDGNKHDRKIDKDEWLATFGK